MIIDNFSFENTKCIKNAIYKSFKELSYDKSNKLYLVQSKEKAIDFDLFKNTCYPNLKSDDALYIDKSNKIVLIEFKNGKLIDYINDFRRKKTNDLIEKNNDSIQILINTNIISNTNINCVSYIFVYNSKKYPEETYKNRFYIDFSSKSKTLKSRLGLNIFDNILNSSDILDNVSFDKKYK